MTLRERFASLASKTLEFCIESTHRDLELAIHAIIAALGAERGVVVKATQLQLVARSERALDFSVRCEVRAMIVSATLVVRGRAVIGDDLRARFDELAMEGDGMIVGLAKAALGPRLEVLRQSSYPIASLNLPGVAVCGVRIEAGETIRLQVTLEPTA